MSLSTGEPPWTGACRQIERLPRWTSRLLTWLALCSMLGACSPALDWREFSPEGSGLVVTMPCQPERYSRVVELAGAKATMTLLACEAGGATYSLSFIDLPDPSRVRAALLDWRRTTIANMQGDMLATAPMLIKGMTANDESVRVHLAGRLPDGSAINGDAAYFVRGLRLYQAVMTGKTPSVSAAETFFTGLRFSAATGPK